MFTAMKRYNQTDNHDFKQPSKKKKIVQKTNERFIDEEELTLDDFVWN